jgi:hypothetical protein
MPNPSAVSFSPPRDWWPSYVAPFGHPDHQTTLTKWLLEVVPQSLRSHPVVHRHVLVLLLMAQGQLAGALAGMRETYAGMRADLAHTLPPETIAAALVATAECGKELQVNLDFVQRMIRLHES